MSNPVSKTLPRLAAVLCAGLAAAPALAQDATWEVVNDSPLTLMELYASPVSAPGWSDDILGSRAIGPGESGAITVADGQRLCAYDFQFVMEDGSTIERRADICAEGRFVLE
ncbi:MAG: hypothetical protein H3C51_11060 [Rubellimicrobium sp.]|nr:hypothetical protein [Rubellimicrobium sp.]